MVVDLNKSHLPQFPVCVGGLVMGLVLASGVPASVTPTGAGTLRTADSARRRGCAQLPGWSRRQLTAAAGVSPRSPENCAASTEP